MTEWGELLVRRRSAHDQFERLPSAYNEISQQELEELKASYFLDDKQVDDYIKSFRKYDEDKSGDIDNPELALVIKDLYMYFPPVDIYDMIQVVDVDGSR